jgi:hypothetical protein
MATEFSGLRCVSSPEPTSSSSRRNSPSVTAVARVLLGALGVAAARLDGIQPAVSQVLAWHGRAGVKSRGVLEELRPPARLRTGATVLRRSEQTGEAIHERRTLHCGRHADSRLEPRKRASVGGTATTMKMVLISIARSAATSRMRTPLIADARLYKKGYDKESTLSYLGTGWWRTVTF